jgi:anti-sigma B factor antagonist
MRLLVANWRFRKEIRNVSDFELKRDGNKIVVDLSGDLVASMVPGLKSALQQALQEGVLEVEFNLGNTSIVDSTGIGVLIATYNSMSKNNGKVRVVLASEDIFRLLQSMRLEKRLSVSKR